MKPNITKGKGLNKKHKINVIQGDPELKIEKSKPKYCFKQSYNYADLSKDKDLIYHRVST